MIYFTGCTHFSHKNIIKMANRPFTDELDMNMALIENWNSVVKRGDTVYHLGDVTWDYRYWETFIKPYLEGTVYYIKGNHDPVSKALEYQEISWKNTKFILFHYPIEDWNARHHGSIHLHCHTHDHNKVTAKGRFNVTVEANNYTPVSIGEIYDTMRLPDNIYIPPWKK